jgi:hypothetical protein
MPLLGSAAMLLQFDVAPEAIDEHDDWHTHEHLPERLSIPGFLRGTRWVAVRGQPRYLVIYEVEELAVLTSAPYLQRLDNPTPWTAKMMPHYRGMSRGLCAVTASFGLGSGNVAALTRFKPRRDAESSLREWLVQEILPGIVSKPGVGSAHLLQGAATAAMTNEQRIRGADAGVDWALLVAGYRPALLDVPGDTELARHGAEAISNMQYGMDYCLVAAEVR